MAWSRTCRTATSGFAGSNTHRALRKGFPEVVFGLGKTEQQIVAICDALVASESRVW